MGTPVTFWQTPMISLMENPKILSAVLVNAGKLRLTRFNTSALLALSVDIGFLSRVINEGLRSERAGLGFNTPWLDKILLRSYIKSQ